MVAYLLKKSYQLKDLKEVSFNDLWGDHGVFTTMWIFNKPPKILFFEQHIDNLIKSIKVYKISNVSLKKDILKFFYFFVDASFKIHSINSIKVIPLYLAISGTRDKLVIPG